MPVSLHMQAGDNLVVLEVESTEVCQTGLEEVEHHWKEDKEAALNPCKKLKHVLQRTARDSPDVRFVTLEVTHSNCNVVSVHISMPIPAQ